MNNNVFLYLQHSEEQNMKQSEDILKVMIFLLALIEHWGLVSGVTLHVSVRVNMKFWVRHIFVMASFSVRGQECMM